MRNPATIPASSSPGQERKVSMARKRYQKGSLNLLGQKGREYWEARWREDVITNGSIHRIGKKRSIGTLVEFPSKRLAQREFDRQILDEINGQNYKPKSVATFAEFVIKWQKDVLSQFKPSSQRSMKCEVKHLVAYFGAMKMADVSSEDLQSFISSRTMSPKYTKNLIADFKTIWKTARAWNYVTHDPCFAIRLPKVQKNQAPAFTLDETVLIMSAAVEPFFTMYWVAATLGPRGGELCAPRVKNLLFETRQIEIVESLWNGKLQTPKSGNSIRTYSISHRLAEHLKSFVKGKRPEEMVFLKPDGSFYSQAGVQRYNLKPLLKKLKVACNVSTNDKGEEVVTVKPNYGLHSFRHANATFMDQLNAPAAVRMARLGHGDLGTTMGYTHLVSEDDRRIADGIDDLLVKEEMRVM